MSAGKSKNKVNSTTKFSDVAGMAEVKDELIEVIDFLKNPKKFHKV
jgi:cell division protease FtsH